MASRHMRHFKVNSPVLSALSSIDNWPSVEAQNWAHQTIPSLCGHPNVRTVVLFGSIVRSVPVAADLDVLCIFEDSAPRFPSPPIDVDLRKYEQKEVEKLLASGNDLLSWCVKFGRVACERDRYWSQIVERWANKIRLPSVKITLERARKSEQLLREMDTLGDNDAALEIYLSLLTHIARARLIQHDIYPASRPELIGQLTQAGEMKLAAHLDNAIAERNTVAHAHRKRRSKIWRTFLSELRSEKALRPYDLAT